MSLTPTELVKNAAKHAENESKTGYDPVSGVWFSHDSPEGGLATIGYGHKGGSSDEVASWSIGGLTDEQVNKNFVKDWDEAFQVAANQYNAAHEDSFSDLPEIGQALLSEIAFNVGGVNNSSGGFGWPNLVKAIKEDDLAGMKKEINRTYTDSDGNEHSMDRRVGFLRDAIDDSVGAPLTGNAPNPANGEDVGSIEALPDSYSHKIGDFLSGLMGGNQATRNRRTQTISGLMDWTPVGGKDLWDEGKWEAEKGDVGDGALDMFMGGLDFIPGATVVTKPAKAAAKVVSEGADKATGLMSAKLREAGESLFTPESMAAAKRVAGSDRSRETLVYMPPEDFLKMADAGEDASKAAGVKALREEGKQFSDVPFLSISDKGEGTVQVVGHEGRHRARQAIEEGVATMPVRLNSVYHPKGGYEFRWGELADEPIESRPYKMVSEDGETTLALPKNEYFPYETLDSVPATTSEPEDILGALVEDAEVEAINAAAGVSDLPRATSRIDEAKGWDWSTEKPQEFNTGGMVGMMTPTLEVIVGHDEESGNPIPAGSTDKEVRDDVEALLSEGEYVLPADVVKWHGLKHIQEMRNEAKAGLMCMCMDGQIKTPESDEDYEEPSDDEDVEVTEEGNEIEVVDNTDEKKIKAADGGLVTSGEDGGTSSLGYLIRRLVRGPDGRMIVRYFDPQTGMYVDDPTGYEVLDQSAYNSLTGPGMQEPDSGEDTAAEEVVEEAATTSGGGSDKDDDNSFEAATPIERNQWNDYGFSDPNTLATMGAGLLGGPLVGGLTRFGQSHNNAEAVDAAREDLGMEGLGWWDKVKGGFTGKYNTGEIGRGTIGENDYTAGFGGRVLTDEDGNQITTLTPNEYKKRTAAQDIDISKLPSATDSSSGSGIMSSQVNDTPTSISDDVAEKEDGYSTPAYTDHSSDVEMDTDFGSWWDDIETDEVEVDTAPHAEISGESRYFVHDMEPEDYTLEAGLVPRDTASPTDEIQEVADTLVNWGTDEPSEEFFEDQMVREGIFQRGVLENGLKRDPVPSGSPKTKQEVKDSLDYAKEKYGFLAKGGR